MPYRVRSFAQTRKKAKYKNVPQDFQGAQYHSKLEAKYARDLELRRRAGEILRWERQVKIELFGENGSHVCDYWIDFVVYHPKGTVEYVEVKGPVTAVWRLKWKLFVDKMKNEPDVELTVVR